MVRWEVEEAIDATFFAEIRRLYGVLVAALAAQEERCGEERFVRGITLAARAHAIAKDAIGRLTDDT